MPFQLFITDEAKADLAMLKRNAPVTFKKARKALRLLSENPRHPGLHTHRYNDDSWSEPIWQSYVENNTPAARRIWWFYGDEPEMITVVRIIEHP